MGDYEVLRIPHGWTVKNGVADFDIHSPHLDRGQIRGVLTIRQGVDDGVVILYRNTVNLTSERSRQKVVRTLADKHVTVDENLLIALEDACHRPPPSAQENVYRGGGQ